MRGVVLSSGNSCGDRISTEASRSGFAFYEENPNIKRTRTKTSTTTTPTKIYKTISELLFGPSLLKLDDFCTFRGSFDMAFLLQEKQNKW